MIRKSLESGHHGEAAVPQIKLTMVPKRERRRRDAIDEPGLTAPCGRVAIYLATRAVVTVAVGGTGATYGKGRKHPSLINPIGARYHPQGTDLSPNLKITCQK